VGESPHIFRYGRDIICNECCADGKRIGEAEGDRTLTSDWRKPRPDQGSQGWRETFSLAHTIGDEQRGMVRMWPWRQPAPSTPTTRLQILPSRRRIRTIKRIVPIPPLGQYPQLRLYGHLGTAPINKRMRITNRMMPIWTSILACCCSAGRA